jgi:hypothetical protein
MSHSHHRSADRLFLALAGKVDLQKRPRLDGGTTGRIERTASFAVSQEELGFKLIRFGIKF